MAIPLGSMSYGFPTGTSDKPAQTLNNILACKHTKRRLDG